MALNRHFAEANQVGLPVPEGTESGDPVCVGKLHAVALVDRQADGDATCQLDGAFNFSLTGPVVVGEAVTGADIDATEINSGDDSETFGIALEPLANGETAEVPVRLAN